MEMMSRSCSPENRIVDLMWEWEDEEEEEKYTKA